MKYTPKTEEQLAEEALLPEDIYDFEIIDTSDKPSKKGNEMIMLKLCVFDADGNERHIFDYITSGNSFGERKLRHVAAACDLLTHYDSGTISANDFLHKSGKVKLKQQKGTDGYLPKNVVSDYILRDNVTRDTRRAKDIINDDIPF